jgi:predicted nucleic acid-binding protein
MIVADSSVWIDHLRSVKSVQVEQLDRLIGSPALVLGDLVLFELLRGARDDRHARTLEAWMRSFPLQRMVDPELAVAAARHSRRLRSVGVTPRKSIDLLIATFCIERGYELLHRDRDFDLMALHLDLRIADASAYGSPS